MISEITSKQNDIIKNTKALLSTKERKEQNLFIVEGERFVGDVSEKINIKYILSTKRYDISSFECERKYYVSEEIFSYLSDVKTPQGIMAVCEIPKYKREDMLSSKRILYLESVQNPDNVGAIIRSGACLGYDSIILNGNCADPYSPKALRAAAGNTVRVKIYTKEDLSILNELKDSGFAVYGAHLKGETDTKFDNEKLVLIIGNEGNGMSSEATELCDKLIKIKMHSGCESLNAACAAAILMYISME